MVYKFCFEKRSGNVKGATSTSGNTFDPLTVFGDLLKVVDPYKSKEAPNDTDIEKDHYCVYTCSSVQDVPFAIVHYLFLNGYKLRKCEHCGGYFAARTFKQKYCPRKSPYKGYGHVSCGEAVDHIMKKLRNERNRSLKI